MKLILIAVVALVVVTTLACNKPGIGLGFMEGDKPEGWLDNHLFEIYLMKIGQEQLPISDIYTWNPCWEFLLRKDLRKNTQEALKNFCDVVIQLDWSYQGYKGLEIVRICDLPEDEREAYAGKLYSARSHWRHELIVGVGESYGPITDGDPLMYPRPSLKENGLDCSKSIPQ